MNEKYYIAIDRDFKGESGGAGYNRLSIYKVNSYELSKFYIENTLKNIFDNEYPNMRNLYSEKECRINYPIFITNDKRLFQTYRNVLSFEEFEIYCIGKDEKKFLINSHNKFSKVNTYKNIAFQPFELDKYADSDTKILNLVKELINSNKIGFKNLDSNTSYYDHSDGRYYETYISELLGEFKFIEHNLFLKNLNEEYEEYKNSIKEQTISCKDNMLLGEWSSNNKRIFKKTFENQKINNDDNETNIHFNNNPELLDDF